jgi:hypothetical protein
MAAGANTAKLTLWCWNYIPSANCRMLEFDLIFYQNHITGVSGGRKNTNRAVQNSS